MSATSHTNWFWSDWLGDPAVRRLTPAARGVWIDCLALMAAANPIGYLCDDTGRKLTLGEVARVCNATADEVSELLAEIIDKGVASRDRTGRCYNRRMVKEAEIAAKKRRNGKVGGAATRLKWQALSAVPQQMPEQMPRHQKSSLSLKKERLTTSLPGAARARATTVENSSQNPAVGPATALPTGAPSRPPDTTNGEAKQPPTKEVKQEKRLIDQAEYHALTASKS